MESEETMKRLIIKKNCIGHLAYTYWGPTIEFCSEMLSGNYLKPFEELNEMPELNISESIKALKGFISKYDSDEVLFNDLEEIYVRLFINSQRAIPSPLYHSCYLEPTVSSKSLLMGPPTQEMLQRFENVGLAIGDGINEPPDHISLELEYLYFLLDSILKGDPELEDVGEYVTNFMLPWISIFLERLKSEDSQSIYQPITAILIAVLKDIGGRT